jgi:hypothetical protein
MIWAVAAENPAGVINLHSFESIPDLFYSSAVPKFLAKTPELMPIQTNAGHANPNKCRLSPNKCSPSPNTVPRFCIKTVFWPLCNHFKPDFDGVMLGG